MTTDLVNIMSIDLEDWFCAYNISQKVEAFTPEQARDALEQSRGLVNLSGD